MQQRAPTEGWSGYGLAILPVDDIYKSLQALVRHRRNLVKQRARLQIQVRCLLHQTMPGFADLFDDDKLFNKSIALIIANYASARAINGRAGLFPARYQSDGVDYQSSVARTCNRRLRAAAMMMAENLVRKRTRGVTRIGELLIPLLIRLGVTDPEVVESKTSEARGSA